ncbi:hypothetical protein JKP88DRAFT_326853 [Tribonema minus]|uniref:Uncharacterized protein n=1 Tax=Tribonema minus TaxID=303371 RepID=A0A835YQS5_9STRA|nr:hypothetical protein JKP88DRAFT_326853 [Tribonema minus]
MAHELGKQIEDQRLRKEAAKAQERAEEDRENARIEAERLDLARRFEEEERGRKRQEEVKAAREAEEQRRAAENRRIAEERRLAEDDRAATEKAARQQRELQEQYQQELEAERGAVDPQLPAASPPHARGEAGVANGRPYLNPNAALPEGASNGALTPGFPAHVSPGRRRGAGGSSPVHSQYSGGPLPVHQQLPFDRESLFGNGAPAPAALSPEARNSPCGTDRSRRQFPVEGSIGSGTVPAAITEDAIARLQQQLDEQRRATERLRAEMQQRERQARAQAPNSAPNRAVNGVSIGLGALHGGPAWLVPPPASAASAVTRDPQGGGGTHVSLGLLKQASESLRGALYDAEADWRAGLAEQGGAFAEWAPRRPPRHPGGANGDERRRRRAAWGNGSGGGGHGGAGGRLPSPASLLPRHYLSEQHSRDASGDMRLSSAGSSDVASTATARSLKGGTQLLFPDGTVRSAAAARAPSFDPGGSALPDRLHSARSWGGGGSAHAPSTRSSEASSGSRARCDIDGTLRQHGSAHGSAWSRASSAASSRSGGGSGGGGGARRERLSHMNRLAAAGRLSLSGGSGGGGGGGGGDGGGQRRGGEAPRPDTRDSIDVEAIRRRAERRLRILEGGDSPYASPFGSRTPTPLSDRRYGGAEGLGGAGAGGLLLSARAESIPGDTRWATRG